MASERAIKLDKITPLIVSVGAISCSSSSTPSTAENEQEHAVKPATQDFGPPPDGGTRAWLQVVAGFLGNFNTWGNTNSFGIFQATYSSLLDKPPATIAWIGSIQLFLVFFVGAFSGRAVDAGLYRLTLCVGFFLQVFGIFMTSFAGDAYWKVLLAQGICTGLGSGLVFTPPVAIMSTYFARKRTVALATSASGGALGAIVFPLIAQQLLPKVGFGWTVRAMSLVMLVNAAIVVAVARTRLPPRKTGPLVEPAAFKELPYLLYTIGLFFTLWATYFTYYYARTFALNILSTDASISFTILLLLNALGIPGRVVPAILADRFLPANPVYLMSPTIFGAAIIIYCWQRVHDLAGYWAWIVLFGWFGAAIQGLYPPSAACFSPDPSKHGTRIGMIFTIVSFAALTGPPIAGALITAADGQYVGAQVWGATSLMVGGCFITASAVLLPGWRRSNSCVQSSSISIQTSEK